MPIENSFDIILINIEKSIKNNNIICEKKNINNLKYYIISHKWDTGYEWTVNTGYYVAHVVGITRSKLINICRYIRYNKKENINYIWLDSISIDGKNEKNKMETISKLAEIYNNASFVIVNDPIINEDIDIVLVNIKKTIEFNKIICE